MPFRLRPSCLLDSHCSVVGWGWAGRAGLKGKVTAAAPPDPHPPEPRPQSSDHPTQLGFLGAAILGLPNRCRVGLDSAVMSASQSVLLGTSALTGQVPPAGSAGGLQASPRGWRAGLSPEMGGCHPFQEVLPAPSPLVTHTAADSKPGSLAWRPGLCLSWPLGSESPSFPMLGSLPRGGVQSPDQQSRVHGVGPASVFQVNV